MDGHTVVATVERINNLGWMSKVHLRLPDGQTVLGEIPNEELGAIRAGETVNVYLRKAKIFAPHGDGSVVSGQTAG
jgi:hypothetical protein